MAAERHRANGPGRAGRTAGVPADRHQIRHESQFGKDRLLRGCVAQISEAVHAEDAGFTAMAGAMARSGAAARPPSMSLVATAALALAAFAVIGAAGAEDHHDGVAPTLLISLDGFRASYLDAQPESALPNLNALWREGVRASLYPQFVSKTFPNHYSIVTGLNEEHHGIVANHMWDPNLRAEFTMASTGTEWWSEGEPIWVTASRADVRTKTYFWPGSESVVNNRRPDVYFPYDPRTTFEERVDVVAQWVRDAVAETDPNTRRPSPAFMALYFDEPDHAGHVHGPHSAQVKAAVRRVDVALGRLRNAAGADAWNRTNVVVVADHGMAPLSPTRVVNLGDDACGLNFTSLFVTGDGVAAHLWRRRGPAEQTPADGSRPLDDSSDDFGADGGFTIEEARAMARAVTACHPNVTAWAREDVPARLRYSANARIGPVVVAADVGYVMCGYGSFDAKARRELHLDPGVDLAAARSLDPANWALAHVADAGCAPACVTGTNGVGQVSDTHSMSDVHCGGAHGYDNASPEMRAVFLARGPLFRSDGARLVGELGYESSEAEALVGDGAATSDGSVHAGTTADAERWQSRTLAFDNVIVHSIVAAGLGLDLDPASVMPDGAPPPRVDGVLDDELANLLFRDGVGVRSGPGGDGAKKGALTPDEDDDEGEDGWGGGRDGTAAWVVAVGVVAIVVGAIVVGARGYVRGGDANSAYVKLGSVFEPGGGDAEAEIEMPEIRVERESAAATAPAVFASLTEGGDGEGEDAGGGTLAGTSRRLREGDENA